MNKRSSFRLLAAALAAFFLSSCGGPADPTLPDPPPPGDHDVVAIAAGSSFSVALTKGGSVFTWGSNASGQLGDGTTSDASRPIEVNGLTAVTQVAAGTRHLLALDADGQVWAWGHNNRGQIGLGWPTPNGALDQYSKPVKVGPANVVSVAARGDASYALDASGAVWAWGNNSHNELGDGTTQSRGEPSPVVFSTATEDPAPMIEAIYAGFHHVHANDDQGGVWFWGDAGFLTGTGTFAAAPLPTRAAEFSALDTIGFVDFTGSDNHVLAIDAAGTLYGWGNNANGELAEADDVFLVDTPAEVSGAPAPVSSIAAGGGVSVVVSGGKVYTWGTSYFGELGDGSTGGAVRREPAAVAGLDDVVSVAAPPLTNDDFGRHVLAVTEDGQVYTWGYNASGQLGVGDELDAATPSLVQFD